MPKSSFKVRNEVFRQIRQMPAVKKEIHRKAVLIQKAASENGRVEGYMVTDLLVEDPRAATSIMATGHAARHNRKNNALVRALDAGRG
ncbi:hypothetical protein ACIP5Z_01690 [Rothia terrae]|uniref:hypothetical protein n=1 Tax=Rothia terrae TaxID=396015 RepID=UPI0037FE77C7